MPEWDAERALATLDIEQIAFTDTDGNCQGYATRKRQIAINPVAQLPAKTLFHERPMSFLACSEADFTDTERTPKNLREVEAESVALLCCEALNLREPTTHAAIYSIGSIAVSDTPPTRFRKERTENLSRGRSNPASRTTSIRNVERVLAIALAYQRSIQAQT